MECLSLQTLEPDRVLILVHKYMKKEDQEMLHYFSPESIITRARTQDYLDYEPKRRL